MKKLMLLLMMFPLALAAKEWEELDKTLVCGPFQEIVSALTKERYREVPIWVGRDGSNSTQYALFVNTRQGNWTLVQYGPEKGCVLGAGTDSRMVDLSNITKPTL